MRWPFRRCKHPAVFLHVDRHETTSRIDDYFIDVTYHLVCRSCGEKIKISYAKADGGVDASVERAIKREIQVELA